MQSWVYALSEQTVTSLPLSPDQQFSLVLDYLRRQRALLILDNVESLMQSDGRSGRYRPGYEDYGQLLRYLAQREHRSCLLLTSRERPQELMVGALGTPTARFLSLPGLPAEAGREMLAACGIGGEAATVGDLSRRYSGNPLALKLIAETIGSLFDGDVTAFLQANSHIFGDIRDVLDQQFARLTPLETEIMVWLAIVREPVTYPTLRDLLARPPASRQVLEALRSLQRHSLLENYEEGFGLQNVVLEYTTAWLVDSVGAELLDDDDAQGGAPFLARSCLNRYALILAHVKEYVRASQTRLLLQPVTERLTAQLGRRGAEQQVQKMLAALHAAPPVPGYAAANLLHLFLQLEVDLRGYDFSRLYFRQLYLRGVSLPQTNFAQAEIIDSVFTEPFGLVYSAVYSPDGRYLAAGTSEGAIYMWRTTDQQLAQVIQAHSQTINQLAFAQRTTATGETQFVLASASGDQSVAVWALAERGQLLWHTRQFDV